MALVRPPNFVFLLNSIVRCGTRLTRARVVVVHLGVGRPIWAVEQDHISKILIVSNVEIPVLLDMELTPFLICLLLRQVLLGQSDAVHALTSIRPHLHKHLLATHLSHLKCQVMDRRKRRPQRPPHYGHISHHRLPVLTSVLLLDWMGWSALGLVPSKVGLASQRGRAGHRVRRRTRNHAVAMGLAASVLAQEEARHRRHVFTWYFVSSPPCCVLSSLASFLVCHIAANLTSASFAVAL